MAGLRAARRDHAARQRAGLGRRPCHGHAHVDGNDADLVHAAAKEAVAAIRATGRPYFLELVTYRQRGHYEPDDQVR